MFENSYDVTYKLLMAALILIALYSMLHPARALTNIGLPGNNTTI
jgi:hypothetical protein